MRPRLRLAPISPDHPDVVVFDAATGSEPSDFERWETGFEHPWPRHQGARACAAMAKAPNAVAPEPLSAGWGLLADGEWEAARALFADALAREETPEALEGIELGWAVAR